MVRARMRPAAGLFAAALLVTLFPLASIPATAGPVVPVSSKAGCDPIDPADCLLPFPNDVFTTDADTPTGRRIDFHPAAMPRTGTEVTEGGEGKPIDPTEWNRNDGFSPGSMVMAYVPDLDLHKTWGTEDRPHSDVGINEPGYFDHRDHITDIGLYAEPDAPIVIVNAATGERHPIWSELDSHPDAVDAGERVLILRPAVNFEEGTRYVVGLRNLRDGNGDPIEQSGPFAAYRDGTGGDERQDHYDNNVFPVLEATGFPRAETYLAWDFTVASEQNLAGRILTMRDDAFGRVLRDTNLADRKVEGDAPQFVVDATSEVVRGWTDSHGVDHSRTYRRVEGRVTVPNYMDRIQQTESHLKEPGTIPGSSIQYDAPAPGSRLFDNPATAQFPDQNPLEPTVNAYFVCEVPLNGRPNHPGLYGHGLLGQARSQIQDFHRSPAPWGPFFGCAADWWGMSTQDLPTVAAITADLSLFATIPDRAQQGFLNFMFLGRAAIHPDGFVTHPAFRQDTDGDGKAETPLVAAGEDAPLFYDGNSQGGIMGGSLVAVSPDITRGILGVPGMNYSTLLNRSVDYEPPGIYSTPTYAQYRDVIERQIAFSLIQMLWDRGEANGYAHHMTTDPLENTPPHEVMLQVAFSDHQVANVSAEVEARTIGAPIMVPGLAPDRHWEMEPYFAATAIYPYQGSALVYWDSGNATPPNANLPPTHARDPHGHPRREPASGWQEAEFLLSGWMVDVCQGGFYLTREHPANGGSSSCKEPDYAPGTRDPGAPVETALAFTGGNESSGQYSDATNFEVRLLDDSNEPIAGAEIVFELSGQDVSRTYPATTDEDGIARATPVLADRPGSYTLTASFAGNETHGPALESTSFEILHEETIVTVEVSGRGKNRVVTGHLFDADSLEGIGGRVLEFFADGEPIGTATTDDEGTASVAAPPRYRGGSHTFEARFAGDDFYLSSSGSRAT